MREEEAHREIERLTDTVTAIASNWDERAPTQLASALSSFSIPTLLEIVSRTPETPAEDELHLALAKMVLARYAKEDGNLEEMRAELWEVLNADDARTPVLRTFLHHIQDIAAQQLRSHPSRETYRSIRLLADEILLEMRNRPLQPVPRRRRRPLAIKLARTSELPDISNLTFEPVDKIVSPKRHTNTLSALPDSIQLPLPRAVREIAVDLEKIPDFYTQAEALMTHLPPLFALLEQWQDEQTPFALAELLHPLSIQEILKYSAYLLPHSHQEFFLRYVSIFLHLKLISTVPLPHLTEALRLLITEPEPAVERILTAIIYYMYCSSHSFFAIQEQALKRLENQQESYLFHRISQEWTANKLIRNFLRASLTRSDQYTVKNLSPFDWEYVFFILNRGWGQSVMRDVYGVFHGSSVFADHIVLPDTSKGFGQIREPGKGVSFTLATQQISDLLLSHSKLTPESSVRTNQIEQFLQERWRKDVLKKELRPTLNAPTLKRVERFVQQIFQRGQSERLALEQVAQLVTREALLGFGYLSLDRLSWFVYEFSGFLWRESEQNPTYLIEICKGMLNALLQVFIQEFWSKREHEAEALLYALWEGWYSSLLDYAGLHLEMPELIEELRELLKEQIPKLRDKYLEPARRQFFEQFESRLESVG